jgi:hypothetical protein
MNVAILSMQKITNYGSFLQAFALKKIIEEQGATVFFIDIKQGERLKYPALQQSVRSRKRNYMYLLLTGKITKCFASRKFMRNREQQFHDTFYQFLEIDKKGPEYYDLVVIGSDEVFNACQPSPWGFSTQLFGDGLPARRVVSYAASFGYTTLKEINENEIASKITDALSNMSIISVRDKNSFDIVKKLTGKDSEMHLDPVLVYDWPELPAPEKMLTSYILIYTYQKRISDDEVSEIRQFARLQKKKLISINCFYDWCDSAIMPETPFDVLTYFKMADYVITDTFHGTIFSIINQKKFCSLIRDSNRNKLIFLLDQLDQSNRAVFNATNIGNVLMKVPSYAKTRQILKDQKEETTKYIRRCMGIDV